MKKKTVLAVLVLCMALTVSACGNESDKQAETENTEGAEPEETSDTEEESNDEPEDSADESAQAGESADDDASSARLVSVEKTEDYVTIGEYKGLTLEKVVQEVTDEDVELWLEYELRDSMEEVTDAGAAVQTGDQVTIDYTGTRNGKEFEGGSGSNYELVVGDGFMIPEGFEDALIGMKAGETKKTTLVFPDYYPDEELAGQEADYQITINKIYRLPMLSDEWVSQNTDFSTVDEYRESVRAQLEESAENAAQQNLYASAWQQVLDGSEIIEYPQKDLDNAVLELKKMYQDYADQADMTFEEFLETQGMTEEAFEAENTAYAKEKVLQNLIVQGIMDAEGLSLDDEECLALQDQLIADYGAGDLAELIDWYGQTFIDESLGLLRVEQFIVENASVTDQISDGELVGVDADAALEQPDADLNENTETAAEDVVEADADIEGLDAEMEAEAALMDADEGMEETAEE